MRQRKNIQLKAAFLLTVFALNTVIAFACSVGLKMGYNDHHHDKGKTVQNLSSPSSNSHCHPQDSGKHHHEDETRRHNHESAASSHHQEGAPVAGQHKGTSEQDDCCTSSAIKFQAQDKKTQQLQDMAIKAPVFVAFLSAFIGFDVAPTRITIGTGHLIPRFYPPPDIRIAIQSFQI